MPYSIPSEARTKVRSAFRDQSLALYLGAGVSVGSRLPSWEKLVVSMYFATVSEQKMRGWRPYPNYLYAISEWYLKRLSEPLEVTARKTRALFKFDPKSEKHFRRAVQESLYGIDPRDQQVLPPPNTHANTTLQAVAELCQRRHGDTFGVRSVVTYNYDNLLEIALNGGRATQPIYSEDALRAGKLPVFHVHGYVPHPDTVSTEPSEIVFTEEEYNRVAIDPYSWSNIVQIREMSNAVGLMVGLSLADRNIRRLLDALRRSPVKPEIYALMPRPDPAEVSDDDTLAIHEQAIELIDEFLGAGIKLDDPEPESSGATRRRGRSAGVNSERLRQKSSSPVARRKSEARYSYEIRKIISHVHDLEQGFQEDVLRSLGVYPIWYDRHDEVPAILGEVMGAA